MRMKIKKGRCIFCGEDDKRILGINCFENERVYACQSCIDEYGGPKELKEAYEICNVILHF